MLIAIFPLSFIYVPIIVEVLAFLKELSNVRINKAFNK